MFEIHGLKTSLIGPIDLAIDAGECVAILGPSGAGKSLFLRAIVDLDLNRGQVLLNGEARASSPAHHWRRKVALVPAESGWWADTVQEHFAGAAEIEPLLDAVGMGGASSWEVSRLSSGERHRLAIARAVHLEPSVLLLDEPTGALDSEATLTIEQLITQLLARGVSVLLVTHDQQQADRLAKSQWRMVNGHLSAGAEQIDE